MNNDEALRARLLVDGPSWAPTWLRILFDFRLAGRWPASLAVLFAFILGTSPLMNVFGIGLQTKNGKKAGRLRCASRTAVAWLPFLVDAGFGRLRYGSAFPLLRVDDFGSLNYRLAIDPSELVEMVLNWDWPLVIATIIVAAIVYSMASPKRGIPDLVAGTYLVPK
jgi:hypothetical protein